MKERYVSSVLCDDILGIVFEFCDLEQLIKIIDMCPTLKPLVTRSWKRTSRDLSERTGGLCGNYVWTEVFHKYCNYRRFGVAKWIYEVCPPRSIDFYVDRNATFYLLSITCDYEMMHWMDQRRDARTHSGMNFLSVGNRKDDFISHAYSAGNLGHLLWLYEKFREYTGNVESFKNALYYRVAFYKHHLDVVKWIVDKLYVCIDEDLLDYFDSACENNKLKLAQYLYSKMKRTHLINAQKFKRIFRKICVKNWMTTATWLHMEMCRLFGPLKSGTEEWEHAVCMGII